MAVSLFFSFATSILLWWLFFPASFGRHIAEIEKARRAAKENR